MTGIIQRQLRHGTVWTGRDDRSPIDGLRRAVEGADAETLAAWGSECSALLEAGDVALRTLAIAALDVLPCDAALVVALLHARPSLYRDVEAVGYPLHPPLLEHALYQRLARDCHPAALGALRAQLRYQPTLAVLLARRDGAWLVEHAALVERFVLGGVLRGLPRALRPRLLEAMAPWVDAIEVLQAPWWRGLEDADALRQIVAAG
jgi:hypothetical protein